MPEVDDGYVLPEWQPRAGEMHPVDQAFYDLAIKERDYERVRYDRVSSVVEDLEHRIGEFRQVMVDLKVAYEGGIRQALGHLSYTQCPFFKDSNNGTCDRGCHSEPACITDVPSTRTPDGGWVEATIEVLEWMMPDLHNDDSGDDQIGE